jgi:hypothetical protein
MSKMPRWMVAGGAAALGLFGLYFGVGHLTSAAADSNRIEVWHGVEQRVGHLGEAQADFNLLGRVREPDQLVSLQYRVNDAIPVELNVRGYRRLAADGDFNADIPIESLMPGANTVTLEGRFADGQKVRREVTVERLSGSTPLPLEIDWADVADPQDVGQYVDGEWRLGEQGLRTGEVGYDRLFLIGERDWQDYEITAEVTVHRVTEKTGPVSGDNGLGLVMRFAGHTVGGEDQFPVAQPKWGYQPFGAIAWLRWKKGAPQGPAFRQAQLGSVKDETDHGTIEIRPGQRYVMKARAQTLPDDAWGHGVSRYAFKIWPAGTAEPKSWDWQDVLTSGTALRRGAVGLLAHHVDVSFGKILIEPLDSGVS